MEDIIVKTTFPMRYRETLRRSGIRGNGVELTMYEKPLTLHNGMNTIAT